MSRLANRIELAVSILLLMLGANIFTFTRLPVLLLSSTLIVAGVGLFVHALILSDAGRRTWRTKLALTLVSTFLGALALIVPLLLLQQRTVGLQDVFDPVLGWAARETPEVVGMHKQRVDPARAHVLVAGDSILWGHGVQSHETAVAIMDGWAQERGPVQLLNLSVSGWSIDQYYLELQRVIPWTKPKALVVGVYSGNDFEITNREYGWGHSKPLFRMRDGQLVRVTPDRFADNCIDRLSHSLLFRPVWRNPQFAQELVRSLCDAQELDQTEGEHAIAGLFDAIEKLGRDAGAKVTFVLLGEQRDQLTWRDQYGNLPDREIKYQTYHLVLRRLLVEGHHDLIEVGDALAMDGRPFSELFLDQGHYTPTGQRVVAKALYEALAARGIVPALDTPVATTPAPTRPPE